MGLGPDILLLYPPGRPLHFQSSIPTLAAYLKSKGFTVDTLDTPTFDYGISEILWYIEKTTPKSIGVSIPFTTYAVTGLMTVKAIKQEYPEIPLIVGGVHPTICPDEFITYVDTVCIGEGELALEEWLNNVKKGSDFNYIVKGKLAPLDSIPIPDWNTVEIEKHSMHIPTGESAFPIRTVRGCVYDCYFCSSSIVSPGVRYKSVENVILEIEHYIKKYNIKTFSFYDENLTLDRNRIISLCNGIITRELNIKFWAQTRTDLIDPELMRIMKDAGCIGFSYGVETGNAEIMLDTRKGITLEQTEKAFKESREAGLLTAANFMIGHTNDTIETVFETVKFADKINPDYIGFALATPFPGTTLRDEASKTGYFLSPDWDMYHTSRISFIPIGLRNHDLMQLKNGAVAYFHLRKPERLLKKLKRIQGWKGRLSFLKKTWTHRNIIKNNSHDYWENRYRKNGISGKGSRGKSREWRWNLIGKHIHNLSEVVDVGCGDLAFWEGKNCPDYTGIDISPTIIEQNKHLRPNWKFINTSSSDYIEGLKKKNVFCLGLLFHLLDEETYIKTLENLCKYSTKNIIIYTWAENPLYPEITDRKYQYYRPFEEYQHIFKEHGFTLDSFTFLPDRIGGFYFYSLKHSAKRRTPNGFL